MPSVVDKVIEWLSPLKGSYPITTKYGAPVAAGSTKGAPHYGIDFGAPAGTPVYAPAGGVVTTKWNRGGGNVAELVAGDVTLVFAHLKNFVVKSGETVNPGDIIGYVGSTGESVTGAHLHMEAKRAGKPFNPLDLFDPTKASSATDYASTARRVPVQADGNCPVGFHRANDGFFGIGDDLKGAYCEADSGIGAAAAGVLDWTKSLALFLAALLDPQNWLAWAALGGGVMLSMVGLYMIWSAT